MRARLIVNPAAGADRAMALLPLINRRLLDVFQEVDITITADGADAARAGARAARDRYDALYVAGGDGTVNAALRGVTSVAGGTRMPIGIVPCGTGNDFAKALGLGEEPEAALDALLELHVIDVDYGTLNDRLFINTSAGGFVANVSEIVTEELKDRTGKLAYLIGGARVLFGSYPFAARLTVSGDGPGGTGPSSDEIELQMFAVCNAPLIGGGYPIAPSAILDDGLLNVVLVKRMAALEFVRVLQMIGSGEHEGDDRVLTFRASAFELHFNRVVRVNTDGEPLEAERCAYGVRHRAAPFFCGAAPRAATVPIQFSRPNDAR